MINTITPSINYVPHDKTDMFMLCLNCRSERIEAFQCSCGNKFCRSCIPEAFEQDNFGYTGLVECPNCKTQVYFA